MFDRRSAHGGLGGRRGFRGAGRSCQRRQCTKIRTSPPIRLIPGWSATQILAQGRCQHSVDWAGLVESEHSPAARTNKAPLPHPSLTPAGPCPKTVPQCGRRAAHPLTGICAPSQTACRRGAYLDRIELNRCGPAITPGHQRTARRRFLLFGAARLAEARHALPHSEPEAARVMANRLAAITIPYDWSI